MKQKNRKTEISQRLIGLWSKQKNQVNGFTLIEILIASTIFALVMIFATASISQTSNFQGKIRQSRLTSETSRKIASMITQDVREAKGGSLKANGVRFPKGVVLLNCVQGTDMLTSCNLKNDTAVSIDFASPVVNTLVLIKDNTYKVYYSGTHNGVRVIFYKAVDNGVTADINLNGISLFDSTNIISPTSTDTIIQLAGFGPSDASTIKQQAFVKFEITSRTADYNNQPATARAEAVIRSMVTSRNYD